MQTEKIILPEGCTEITIREGKAVEQLPLKEPQKIALSGDIHSIGNFLNFRNEASAGLQAIDKTKAIITCDKDARSIVLQLDPENFYCTTVTAKLQQSNELKAFCINEEKTFSREALLKLFRFNKLYFDDKDLHTSICANLSNITLKSETEMASANDRKGNKKGGIEQKVNMPEKWIDVLFLSIPVFKGFDNVKIRIEICMDVTATGFCFWLESPELVEYIESQIDSIFEGELSNCDGFVIIHK